MSRSTIHPSNNETVTDAEERRLREWIDAWVVGLNGRSQTMLHVPHPTSDDVQPWCDEVQSLSASNNLNPKAEINWKAKGEAVYPHGTRAICPRCSELWRQHDE